MHDLNSLQIAVLSAIPTCTVLLCGQQFGSPVLVGASVYFVPMDSLYTLILHIAPDGTTTHEQKFGHVAGGVNVFQGRRKFVTGVAVGSKVYFVPCVADYVGIMDVSQPGIPITVVPVPGDLTGIASKYSAAALATDGYIYLAPCIAPYFAKIDPATGQITRVSVTYNGAPWTRPGDIDAGECVYSSLVQGRNGKIYFAPYTGRYVFEMDLQDLSLSADITQGGTLFGQGDLGLYSSAILADNGLIYLIPARMMDHSHAHDGGFNFFDTSPVTAICAPAPSTPPGLVCTPCPSNSFSLQGDAACTCNAGYELLGESCSACALGKLFTADGSGCHVCAPGTYFISSTTPCGACGPLHVSPGGVSAQCTQCPANSRAGYAAIPGSAASENVCQCNDGYGSPKRVFTTVTCGVNPKCPCSTSPATGTTELSVGSFNDGSGLYVSHSDCSWTIQSTEVITLSFSYIRTETMYDFVYVNSCPNATCIGSTDIAKVDGWVVNSQYTSTFPNILQVVLTSDGNENSYGFDASWSVPPYVFACAPCVSGKYRAVDSASAQCIDCPANSWTPPQSTQLSQCNCVAGYTGTNGATCVSKCAANQNVFTFTDNSFACYPVVSFLLGLMHRDTCTQHYAGSVLTSSGDATNPIYACVSSAFIAPPYFTNNCAATEYYAIRHNELRFETPPLICAPSSALLGGIFDLTTARGVSPPQWKSRDTPPLFVWWFVDDSSLESHRWFVGYVPGDNFQGWDTVNLKPTKSIMKQSTSSRLRINNLSPGMSEWFASCRKYTGSGGAVWSNSAYYNPILYFNVARKPIPPDYAECSACPPNHAILPGMSLPNISQCVCNAGSTRANDGTCVLCPTNQYKVGLGDAACHGCAQNSHSTTGSSSCTCNAGYTRTTLGVCEMCAIGKYRMPP